MEVNFFAYQEAVPTKKEFAICDDQNQEPVHIENVGDTEHQVVVISNNRTDYYFIAVDHNIPLKREDGSDDKICDAMLLTNETVCFVEIKCWRASGWIQKALEQIATTITHFNKMHPTDKHRFRDAYICNWKRRNVLLKESNKELKSTFYQNYKTHLYIDNTIKELA